jgi:formylglycine-generating enzyme required for sulfatase activity
MRKLSLFPGIGMLAACLALSGCKQLVVEFTADVTSGPAPLAVQFTNFSIPANSPITAWHWIFGDGAESTERNPSHTYAEKGWYTVSLEVTTATAKATKLRVGYITVISPEQTVMLPGNVPLLIDWIPGGTFSMGSPDAESQRNADEGPQHSVTLSGFWMGQYEVTQAQWKAVMQGTNPSCFQSGKNGVPADTNTDNRPVESMTWNDVHTFIAALNVATGESFRLPTEAEWEYACRGGTATRYYWGDDLGYTDIGTYAWYANKGGAQTHDVGGKTANAFGLFDMSGNVWEWVQDWYGPYTAAAQSNPTGPATGQYRSIRGGSFSYFGWYCRSASRFYFDPSDLYNGLGFRLAR